MATIPAGTSYILVEHADGTCDPRTFELIVAAQVLGPVTAVVVGPAGAHEPLVAELAAHGAAAVVGASAPDYSERLITPEVDALEALATAQPGAIFTLKGPRGSEIAGRVALRLGSGVVNNVTGVDEKARPSVSIFADSVSTTVEVSGDSPVFALRAGSVEPLAGAAVSEPAVSTLEIPGASPRDVRVLSYTEPPRSDRPELGVADVVVAGGRGVGEEGFAEYVEPLADALGGAIGSTRDVVELGWVPAATQIGQTGVTISPALYIGLGISGAIHHTCGILGSQTIVAINNDEDAALFEVADLGVVADATEVVPALVAELAARKG